MWRPAGEKAVTHDFLSLYNDSASQEAKTPSQELLHRTPDFLRPPEHPEKGGGGRGPGVVHPAMVGLGGKLSAAAESPAGKPPDSAEARRPGGFCTQSVIHVTGHNRSAPPLVAKPDWFTCTLPPRTAMSSGTRPKPSRSRAVAVAGATPPSRGGNVGRNGGGESYPSSTGAPSREPALTTGGHHRRQELPPLSAVPASRGGNSGRSPCPSSSSQQLSRDTRPSTAMEPKPGKTITDEDEDDDEELVGGKGNPSLRQMMVKVDGGSYSRNFQEQNASTPRSKHSETEQRRRSKINDRFRMLRDLLPCNDQRRDKASLLLEAIEYVQFLQGKVQNYESAYPGWNQDNSKLAPWKINQSPREFMADPSHVTKKVFVSNDISFPDVSPVPGGMAFATNSQVMDEHENVCSGLPSKSPSVPFTMPLPVGGSGENSQLGQRLIPDSENMPRQEVQWPRPVESSVSSDILSGEEEMAIDDGTITLSSKYSEGLLATLTKALRSSGVDLSQANVSVQINLGRQAINRPQSHDKDRDGQAQEQAKKRRRH